MTDDTKLPLTSIDMTEALLAQLRAASPQIFSEGRVDFAKLQAALGEHIETGAERYGLNWAGKRDAFRNVQIPSVATLRPQPEESVNWDSSENLIIEGDNLEVLKLLQKPYHAKVKMIYIDPPYNTGNEFIYPDNFREGLDEYLRYTGQLNEDGTAASTNKDTSGRYHSNWLNMMYPRLCLARNLLKEDGVIFVSIDDHEVHNLRLLMDEVFGEENFIACLVWEKGRKNDAKLFSIGHEYMLVFTRSQLELRERKTVWREEKPGARDIWTQYLVLRDKWGKDDRAIENDLSAWYASLPKSHPAKKWARYKRVDSNGPWRDRDISWPGGGGPRYDVLHPKTGLPCVVPERGWIYSRPDEMQHQIDLGLVEFREDHTSPPFRKAHIRPTITELNDTHEEELGDGEGFATQVRGSYFYKQSQVAVKRLRTLLGGKIFDNPKDHEELAKLFKYVMGDDTSGLVLDFFAGSGSTANAVLDLNQQDGGNRKFILVQLPEKTDNPQYPTIAHITRERVRRVIAKLQESRHSRAGGNPAIQNALDLNPLDSRLRGNDDAGDLGFRAFKLDSSNFKIWNAGMPLDSSEQLAEQLSLYADNVLDGRGDQDRLYELILKCGMPLSARVESVAAGERTAFAVSDGNLLICLEPHLDRDTLRALFAHKPQMVLCLDVAFDGNDALKTNTVLEAQTHGIIFKTV